MAGIRVSDIPSSLTEKHIKTYFCNPEHGGGRVVSVVYPLTSNDAVVMFESQSLVPYLSRLDHVIRGHKVTVKEAPRQMFRKVSVELEEEMSYRLLDNKDLVDDLQLLGELDVIFDSSKCCYTLAGGWYQLEWAWQFLSLKYEKPLDTEHEEAKTTHDFKPHLHFPSTDTFSSSFLQHPNKSPYVRVQMEDPKHSHSLLSRQSAFGIGNNIPELPISKAHSETESSMTGRKVEPPGISVLKPKVTNASRLIGDNHLHAPEVKTSVYMTRHEQSKNLDDNLGLKKGDTSKMPNGDQNKPISVHSSDDDSGASTSDEGEMGSFEYGAGAYGYDYGYELDKWPHHPETTQMWSRYTPVRPRNRTVGIDVKQTDFGEQPLTFDTIIGGFLEIDILLGDITKQKTDAIVSSATKDLSGRLGVAGALGRAAGRQMLEECATFIKEHGEMLVGEVTHTCAGGSIDKRVGFILHAVGPAWVEKESEHSAHLLTCTYLNCLQYANHQLWLRTMAIPLISTGSFGAPLDVSIQAFYDALLLHMSDSDQSRHLQQISLVVNDQDSTCATIVMLRSLIEMGEETAKKAAIDRYVDNCENFGSSVKDFHLGSVSENEATYASSSEDDAEVTRSAGNTEDGLQKDEKMLMENPSSIIRCDLLDKSEDLDNEFSLKERSDRISSCDDEYHGDVDDEKDTQAHSTFSLTSTVQTDQSLSPLDLPSSEDIKHAVTPQATAESDSLRSDLLLHTSTDGPANQHSITGIQEVEFETRKSPTCFDLADRHIHGQEYDDQDMGGRNEDRQHKDANIYAAADGRPNNDSKTYGPQETNPSKTYGSQETNPSKTYGANPASTSIPPEINKDKTVDEITERNGQGDITIKN